MTKPLVPKEDFTEITLLIAIARQRAVHSVNTALIELYWQVGLTISRKIEQAEWGDGVVALGRTFGAHPTGPARFYP